MAESKVDYSQLIGFLFLMAAFVSFLFISQSNEEEIDIQAVSYTHLTLPTKA